MDLASSLSCRLNAVARSSSDSFPIWLCALRFAPERRKAPGVAANRVRTKRISGVTYVNFLPDLLDLLDSGNR
jgi:hypothetical protein